MTSTAPGTAWVISINRTHHSIFVTVPALESTEKLEEGTEHSVLRKITAGVVPELQLEEREF